MMLELCGSGEILLAGRQEFTGLPSVQVGPHPLRHRRRLPPKTLEAPPTKLNPGTHT